MNRMMKVIKTSAIIVSTIYVSGLWATEPGFNLEEGVARHQAENKMRILKFEEITRMTQDVVVKLEQKYPQKKWDGLMAITRGGHVPARLLSQIMDIRRI